jgi:hypothetical protein
MVVRRRHRKAGSLLFEKRLDRGGNSAMSHETVVTEHVKMCMQPKSFRVIKADFLHGLNYVQIGTRPGDEEASHSS